MASSSSSLFDIEPLSCCQICRHAMDACFLCGKRLRLAGDHDIFMYRGDTPFCSEDCRHHQMLRDEAVLRKNKPLNTEHSARNQQQRHHETAAAESARVKIAAHLPVAT